MVVFWASGTAFCFILLALPSHFPLPHSSFLSLTCSSAGGHPLCLRCLTMEIWRPKLRWTEQHSSQIRTPRLILVQPGSDRQTEIDGWYYEPYKHAVFDGKNFQLHQNSHSSPGCINSPTLCFRHLTINPSICKQHRTLWCQFFPRQHVLYLHCCPVQDSFKVKSNIWSFLVLCSQLLPCSKKCLMKYISTEWQTWRWATA